MDAWAVIAYGAFGLSAFASLAQLGNWLLRASPQVLANAGRWSLLLLGAGAAAVLAWLVIGGRLTQAMMLAAFVMPVFVQGAARWRGLFGPLTGRFRFRPRIKLDFAAKPPAGKEGPIDPELVRQSVAVLTAYLDQAQRLLPQPVDASLGGWRRISGAEAREMLGLAAGAEPDEICEAHRRLRQSLDPALGGSRYLAQQIDEARDALLGATAPGFASAERRTF